MSFSIQKAIDTYGANKMEFHLARHIVCRLTLAWRLVILALFLFAGCSDDTSSAQGGVSKGIKGDKGSESAKSMKKGKGVKKKKKKSQEEKFKIDQLPPETPVMVVEGKVVTQKDYQDYLDLKCRIMLAKQGKLKDAKEFEKVRRSNRARIPTEIIRYELMRRYAETNGISPTADQLNASKMRVLGMFGKGNETLEQVAAMLGGASARILPMLIHQNALDEACVLKNATNDVTHITDAELDERLALVKKWNDTAKQKDQESIDKAAKAKKEILAGAKFEVVARKYAEVSPGDGREWDTVELGEFQADEPLAQWLMTAKVGDVSDPMEYEEVIAIFGLKGVEDVKLSDDEPPVKQFELVRCAFHAYEKIEVPEDREVQRADMLEYRRAEVFRNLGSKLLECAHVEFPQGESIFNPTVRKKARPKGAKGGGKGKAKKPKEKSSPIAPSPDGAKTAKEKSDENKR